MKNRVDAKDASLAIVVGVFLRGLLRSRSTARTFSAFCARSCEMSCKPLRAYKRASAAFSGRDYRDYYRAAHFFHARITHAHKHARSYDGHTRDYSPS